VRGITGMAMNAMLDKLLLETKTLSSAIPSSGLPQLHRNIMQLDAASRKFSRKAVDPYVEQKAYVSLHLFIVCLVKKFCWPSFVCLSVCFVSLTLWILFYFHNTHC
jgi:hypothetical protein